MNVTPVRNPPLRILLAALGGEGGGVLMNWIVAAARDAGYFVQATSVPGVAQRTGSTSYYIEIAASDGGEASVLNLFPMPGRVDAVVASELVEAARVMDAGFVSPQLTTLISSTSRLLTIDERKEMGDGRYADAPIHAAAEGVAKDAYILDLGRLAAENDTFISATMFGALAGSGVLPWDVEVSQRAIGEGKSADASLAGFEAARLAVEEKKTNGPAPAEPTEEPQKPQTKTDTLPESVRTIVDRGVERCADFQDAAYGKQYLDRVQDLAGSTDLSDPQAVHALGEAARRLALWMAYEDVARVADLKTQPERFQRIRDEAQMRPDQILRVVDYLKPRAEEIADILPVKAGRAIMARVARGKSLPFLGRGIRIRSNGIFGYWMLRFAANLRRIRRLSLRFHEETAAIDGWHKDMKTSLKHSAEFSGALAELPRVLKGYSDTLLRGKAAYAKITAAIVRPAVDNGTEDQNTDRLRSAIAAALADDGHTKLDALLAEFAEAAWKAAKD